ncbi:hypothetical protein ACLBWZ_16485 [Brucellaceae bacterium C25G]
MNWQEIWPRASDKLTAIDLQSLDDSNFSTLLQKTFSRNKKSHNKRKARNVSRKLIMKRRPIKRLFYSKNTLLARKRDCEFLDSFVPDRTKKWKTKLKERKIGTEVECKNFSFIDNPVETLKSLKNIAEAECNSVNFRINFIDDYINDVGPYLVLGLMRESMAPFVSGGKLSPRVAKVIEAIRLREILKMKSFGRVSAKDVWPLPIQQRRGTGTSRSQHLALEPSTVEFTADAIVDKVNTWFGLIDDNPHELSPHGAGKLRAMVGEILNNAERHSHVEGDGSWIIAGFMARREITINNEKKFTHICNLCFFNPGLPISETIINGPKNVRVQIAKYQSIHHKSKLTVGTLATVLALQDGISRVEQDGLDEPTGGTGLMDVVEFCNEIGQKFTAGESPKIVLISGTSYIRFEEPYLYRCDREGSKRRIQWFNVHNDAKTAPDSSHVKDLAIRFPGTLITARFTLDGSIDGSERDGKSDN